MKMKSQLSELDRNDFISFFNALWYRDFPITKGNTDAGRADWNRHIGICIRQTADLLGYFTNFESGLRFDAVIRSPGRRNIANVEWEWDEPSEGGKSFNEVKKLREGSGDADFSVLITWSRDERHEKNLQFVQKRWKYSEPLLLFVLRVRCPEGKEKLPKTRGRRLKNLETWLIRNGKRKGLREQKGLPWEVDGKKWNVSSAK